MNFNNLIVILLHLVILFEIVSSYYDENNSHKHRHRSKNGRDRHNSDRKRWDGDKKWSGSSRSWHKKKNSSLTRSRVILPSGNPFYVTNPRMKRGWKCGDKANMITLNPTGAMGKREYDIVKSEMEAGWGFGANFPGQILKVQKIENPCLWSKYQHRKKEIVREAKTANEHLLFHGSPAVLDIINTGLDERYAKINGEFGAGLYFASHSAKSNWFIKPQADGTKLMLLCRVALGKLYTARVRVPHAHAPAGYHSVKGDVAMPEFVVYRGEQAYPEYLITYK